MGEIVLGSYHEGLMRSWIKSVPTENSTCGRGKKNACVVRRLSTSIFDARVPELVQRERPYVGQEGMIVADLRAGVVSVVNRRTV